MIARADLEALGRMRRPSFSKGVLMAAFNVLAAFGDPYWPRRRAVTARWLTILRNLCPDDRRLEASTAAKSRTK